MTEKLTVEDGRLKVARVEGKESLDLDLAEVDYALFERSPEPQKPGALVLVTTEGRRETVRVDNDDIGSVMEQLRPALDKNAERRATADAPAGATDEKQEPQTAAPAESSEPAPATTSTRTSRRR